MTSPLCHQISKKQKLIPLAPGLHEPGSETDQGSEDLHPGSGPLRLSFNLKVSSNCCRIKPRPGPVLEADQEIDSEIADLHPEELLRCLQKMLRSTLSNWTGPMVSRPAGQVQGKNRPPKSRSRNSTDFNVQRSAKVFCKKSWARAKAKTPLQLRVIQNLKLRIKMKKNRRRT